jgi:hypothetical protein
VLAYAAANAAPAAKTEQEIATIAKQSAIRSDVSKIYAMCVTDRRIFVHQAFFEMIPCGSAVSGRRWNAFVV